MTIILSLITIFCSVSAVKYLIATHALVKYLHNKNYTPPSEEEMAACTKWVVKKMLKIK